MNLSKGVLKPLLHTTKTPIHRSSRWTKVVCLLQTHTMTVFRHCSMCFNILGKGVLDVCRLVTSHYIVIGDQLSCASVSLVIREKRSFWVGRKNIFFGPRNAPDRAMHQHLQSLAIRMVPNIANVLKDVSRNPYPTGQTRVCVSFV